MEESIRFGNSMNNISLNLNNIASEILINWNILSYLNKLGNNLQQ